MRSNRIVRKHSLGSKADSLLAKLMRQHKLNLLEACSLLALLTIPRYQILTTNEQVRMAKKMLGVPLASTESDFGKVDTGIMANSS
jgi:hypothetical protein